MGTETEKKFLIKKNCLDDALLGASGCEIEQGYLNKSIQINGRWSDVIITVNKGSDDLFSINILKEKDGTSARRFKYIIPEKDYLDILKLQPDGNICSKLTTLNVLTVRVRIKNKKSAKLTIKGETKGISRPEFEYDIPLSDAVVLMKYCRSNVVNKVRYEKEYKGNVFEIDVFTGINAGLVLAEVEMDDPDADIDLPFFIGEDVSHSEKYYNECIAAKNAFKYCKIGENKFIEIYKNIRVINHTSQMNLTFIRFERWLTDAGNIALRVLEGFGIEKDINGDDVPSVFKITPASYYKDERAFMARMRREVEKRDMELVII